MIHASSIVAADAVVGENAEVGPFCVLGVDGTGEVLTVGRDAVIRSHVVLYRGTTVGDAFHAAHGVLVRESTSIGCHVSVGSQSIIEHHVDVGDGVRLHSRCFVPEHCVLEAGAWIGPGVILTNSRHPNRPDSKAKLRGVRVGRGAVVGAGAVLLPGVCIGAGAIVGAGAVVVHDVSPGATVVGNPARPGGA